MACVMCKGSSELWEVYFKKISPHVNIKVVSRDTVYISYIQYILCITQFILGHVL